MADWTFKPVCNHADGGFTITRSDGVGGAAACGGGGGGVGNSEAGRGGRLTPAASSGVRASGVAATGDAAERGSASTAGGGTRATGQGLV